MHDINLFKTFRVPVCSSSTKYTSPDAPDAMYPTNKKSSPSNFKGKEAFVFNYIEKLGLYIGIRSPFKLPRLYPFLFKTHFRYCFEKRH